MKDMIKHAKWFADQQPVNSLAVVVILISMLMLLAATGDINYRFWQGLVGAREFIRFAIVAQAMAVFAFIGLFILDRKIWLKAPLVDRLAFTAFVFAVVQPLTVISIWLMGEAVQVWLCFVNLACLLVSGVWYLRLKGTKA